MKDQIEIIKYFTMRPLAETMENLEELGLQLPEEPIIKTFNNPVNLEYIGVLIPYYNAIKLETGQKDIQIEDLLVLTAESCLSGNWRITNKEHRLYTTAAGYLIMFARLVWNREDLDLDLSDLKE